MIRIEGVYYSHSRKLISFKKNKEITYLFENLSQNIEEGEKVALLGFNGAGKSTLIKIILGIIHPQKGVVYVDNVDIHKNRVNVMKDIGVVWGQRSTLWWDIPVIESFKTLQKIYKVPEVVFRKRLSDFDKEFRLSEYWDKPIRQLSLGQRVKAEIVASLLHNPKILVYDEPFNGLDFITKKKIIEVLKKVVHEENKTLILTSHDMYDIECLCEKIIVLGNKNILKEGSVKALSELNVQAKEIIVEIEDSSAFEISDLFRSHVNISKLEPNMFKILFKTSGLEESELLEDIIKNNKLKDIQINKQSLKSTIEKFLENS